MTPVIELQNIQKIYHTGGDEFYALKNISLSIYPGEFVAITGPSGSGKSTLMHIIGLLDKPSSGSVLIDGVLVGDASQNKLAELRNRKIGFVFQSFNLLKKTKAIDNVVLPLVYSDINKKEFFSRAKKELESVGLGNKINNLPSELSGGQQQRVAIARALVNNPSLVLADEPTGNLDSKSGAQIMQLFRDLSSNGKTIVIVTHDPDIAIQAQRIIRIMDGGLTTDEKR